MLKEVPVCVYADDLFMLLFFSLMQDCIQLNQYKLKSEIGKVSLFTSWLQAGKGSGTSICCSVKVKNMDANIICRMSAQKTWWADAF